MTDRKWHQVVAVARQTPVEKARIPAWKPELAGSLRQFAELEPGAWRRLSFDQRLDFLRDLERALARGQGRKPAAVQARKMRASYGMFSGYFNRIEISTRIIRKRSPRTALATVLHEDRHGFQAHAIEQMANPPRTWVFNNKHYQYPSMKPVCAALALCGATIGAVFLAPVAVTGLSISTLAVAVLSEANQLAYWLQPVERDARRVQSVARIMYPRGASLRKLPVRATTYVQQSRDLLQDARTRMRNAVHHL